MQAEGSWQQWAFLYIIILSQTDLTPNTLEEKPKKVNAPDFLHWGGKTEGKIQSRGGPASPCGLVCAIFYYYPATCGPKPNGSSSAAA